MKTVELYPLEKTYLLLSFITCFFVMTELQVKMSVSSWEEKRLVSLFDRFLVVDYIEGELC